MEQSSLKQAAFHYGQHCLEHGWEETDINFDTAFQAGAKWQYEQSKDLINIMQRLISAYDFRYPNERQLLVGYTNTQVFEKINALIQNLYDQY